MNFPSYHWNFDFSGLYLAFRVLEELHRIERDIFQINNQDLKSIHKIQKSIYRMPRKTIEMNDSHLIGRNRMNNSWKVYHCVGKSLRVCLLWFSGNPNEMKRAASTVYVIRRVSVDRAS